MIITDEGHNYIVKEFDYIHCLEITDSYTGRPAGKIIILKTGEKDPLEVEDYDNIMDALWVMDALKVAMEKEDKCFTMPSTGSLRGIEERIEQGRQQRDGFERLVETYWDQI